MIRGRGALSFRIGNFFTGMDQEQMRLTEAGDLGIGTSSPQSKLEVAGTIRAQRVLIARPGESGNYSKTQAGISATDTLATDSGDFQPLLMGTGTQDQIAKWIDNAANLTPSKLLSTMARHARSDSAERASSEKSPALESAFAAYSTPNCLPRNALAIIVESK